MAGTIHDLDGRSIKSPGHPLTKRIRISRGWPAHRVTAVNWSSDPTRFTLFGHVNCMDTDKILEIARRYTYPDVREDQTFEFDEEDLIAFAQSVLEEEQEQTAIKVPISVFVKLVKDLNAVKDLLMAMKAAEEE